MADVKVLKQAADFSKLKVIESLDDFPLWSTRLKAHLLTAGLWDEMKSQPTAGNDTTSLLLSITADHFLMPLMDQNLTAPLIWTTLYSLYHVSNLSTKVTSLNQLMSFHFQGSSMLLNRTLLQEAKRKISSAFGGATSLSIDELVMLFAMLYYHPSASKWPKRIGRQEDIREKIRRNIVEPDDRIATTTILRDYLDLISHLYFFSDLLIQPASS